MCSCCRFLPLFLFVALPLCAQTKRPAPLQSFELSKVLSRSFAPAASASIAFLTDQSMALLWLSADPRERMVSVLEWNGDSLRLLAPEFHAENKTFIHASGDEHVILTTYAGGNQPSILYSLSMQTQQQIPYLSNWLISWSGKTAASSTNKDWTLYRLIPDVQVVRSGAGVLLAISDDKLVVQEGDQIVTETFDGKELGSFRVKPPTKCATSAAVLTNSLYFQSCGIDEIADWNGRRIFKLVLPKDSTIATSVDRSEKRVMFDYSTRRVSVLRSAGEVAIAVGTLGAGVTDQKSNGESVRIIDATTGTECFEWDAKLPEEAAPFSHAALSPSGRYVATIVGQRLAIYRLPERCSFR